MRKHFIWVLIIFLLPVLACSLGGGGNDGATQTDLAIESPATPVPAAETVIADVETIEPTQPEPAAEESTSQEFAAVSGLDSLSSYRVNFMMEFDGESDGQPNQGTIEMTMEKTKEPPASHMKMAMEGATVEDVGGLNAMEIYQIGDTVYLKNEVMGDSWYSFSGGEAESFEEGFFAPDEQLEMPKTATCTGTENVNGVEAKHCRFTEKDVDSKDATIESLQGDVWVAVDGGYIVKYTMTATGYESTSEGDDLFGFGNVKFEYNLTDANDDLTITLPPEAENSSMDMSGLGGGESGAGGESNAGGEAGGGNIPVLEGAEELLSMGDFVSYYTGASIADVADFYRQELPALGWAEKTEQSYADAGTAFLTFEKDGQSMIVTITAEEGRTSVIATSVAQ
jgi:hypothetical protein